MTFMAKARSADMTRGPFFARIRGPVLSEDKVSDVVDLVCDAGGS